MTIKTIPRRATWPKIYQWVATTRCGCVYIFRHKPRATGIGGWMSKGDDYGTCSRFCGHEDAYAKRCKSWRSSLRKIVPANRTKKAKP